MTQVKKGHKNNFNNVCERRRLHFPFHFTVYECDKHTNVDIYVLYISIKHIDVLYIKMYNT